MIRIRTITYNLPAVVTDSTFRQIEVCSKLFSGIKYEVHTQRISCTPTGKPDTAFISELSDFCKSSGVRWFNVPLDIWDGQKSTNEDITNLLVQHDNAFVNILCAKNGATKDSVLDFTARQFLINGQNDKEGLINFRFGGTMNVAPFGPFFPFTYSGGDASLSFSIGLEIAEEVNDILKDSENELNVYANRIVQTLEPQIAEIESIAEQISRETGVPFKGIDFSLAPLPKENNSVITVLNSLGVRSINDTGAMFATAFLTRLLKSFTKTHKSVGFSGVMYSLIEDMVYAEDNNRLGFSIDRMIALSTMCGCGCDMVPVPLETPVEKIKTVMLEIACVSSRLQKPLGVRLLPVESTDSFTHFLGEADFCVNTRLVELNTENSFSFTGDYSFI